MVYDLCDKKLWKRSGLGLGILHIHRWARCTIGDDQYAPSGYSVCTIGMICMYH
jgi:hypothetical protein